MKKLNFKILPLIFVITSESSFASGTANVIDDTVIASIASLIASQTKLEHLSIGISNSTASSAKISELADAIKKVATLTQVSVDLNGGANVDDAAITALSNAVQSLPKVAQIDLKVPGNSSAAQDAGALKQIFSSSSSMGVSGTDTTSSLISGLKTAGFALTQISKILPLLDSSATQTKAEKEALISALIPAYEKLNAWGGGSLDFLSCIPCR